MNERKKPRWKVLLWLYLDDVLAVGGSGCLTAAAGLAFGGAAALAVLGTALLAGAVGGVGFGMLFRVGASSGGTDVIVMVARKRWGVDIGSMSFYINVVILFASFVVVDIEKILMGGLLLYVETVTIDRVLKSFDRRSQVLIISKRTPDIADFILNELDRSATIIPAKGAYSDRPHDMLLVVLTRRQTVDLRQYIAEIDPEAFLIFSDVTEVVGLGFKNWE